MTISHDHLTLHTLSTTSTSATVSYVTVQSPHPQDEGEHTVSEPRTFAFTTDCLNGHHLTDSSAYVGDFVDSVSYTGVCLGASDTL